MKPVFLAGAWANRRYLENANCGLYSPGIMTLLDKLERRIGFLAVPGLLRYVGFLTALVFVLEKVNPGYLRLLDLDPVAVMHGEVWCMMTYFFILKMGSLVSLLCWVIVVI